jgi:glyoxylase-like metal-dependent hydrolase (beta-lactamase superfamily II)
VSTGSSRREFLKAAAVGAAGLSLSVLASRRAMAKAEPLAGTVLNDNVVLVTGLGTNAVLVNDSDGSLLVDCGDAERSSDLLHFVSKYSGVKRVDTVFNTHWHWDHTGGNERFAKAGAKIMAHENTKLWLTDDFYSDWEHKHYLPRPREAWPTQTFYTSGKLTHGKDEVVYGYLPRAHTDGDVYIFLPRQNVLVAGDLLSVGSYPILDYTTGGWITGMSDASKALLGVVNDKTIIVPGTGPVQTKADLQAQSDMLATMKDRLLGLLRKGIGTDDLIAQPPTKEFDAKWGDPKLFLANAYRGLWGHVREVGGIV